MSDFLVILGRQPVLGLAELESLYGAGAVRAVGADAALVQADVEFSRLGGAVKLAELLGSVDSLEWRELERYLAQTVVPVISSLPEGKVQIGLSVHGLPVSSQQIMAAGLTLKKAVKKLGRSVRLTPNKEAALNSAQTLHNHLTGPTGCEIIVVRDEDKLLVARAVAVQDIDSYTLRDRGRPKRDTRVGMLPPKLAQIIVNLALSAQVPENSTVLDPFCGTGVVLQEAGLMRAGAYGTDIDERMIRYSRDNLNWLQHEFGMHFAWKLETGDATSLHWDPTFTTVACETYLGRPFTTKPSPEVLARTISECNTIIKKFLQNIVPQLQPGARLCLGVPAWRVSSKEFKHLPLIDQIGEMGYNRMSFEHVRDDELLYYREDQIVARQLIVITRK